jgi:AcrR family transcriptional regulator
VGLGLSERAVDKAFSCKNDLLDLRPSPSPFTDLSLPNRETAKALATRAKILVATIEILKSEGPGAVNGRSVAERAGLTKAAPFYYFPSIADLLSSAQLDLFRRSKDRYRQGLVDAGGFDVDLDHLIDRTATIFLREATEHAAENVANYSIWLRADGESLIGTRVWEVTADQHQSWRNVLRIWKTDLDPLQPLLAQALFIGKLVRVLASGSAVQDMSSVRRDFAFGLRDILSGFWSGTHKQYNLPK